VPKRRQTRRPKAGRPPAASRPPVAPAVEVPPDRPDAKQAVTLRTDRGQTLSISLGVELQRAAMAWSYTVRNRRRWVGREAARDQQAKRCAAELEALGVSPQRLGDASLIEVSVPYLSEGEGWEARIFPWEYVLSAATRTLRTGPLTVVRHLRRRAFPTARARQTAVVVESAPGDLRQSYSFESELRLVQSNLGFKAQALLDPTRASLQKAVETQQPAVVHLSGIDVHQAAGLIELPDQKDRQDGFLLSGKSGAPDVVSAVDLAALVNAGQEKPLFFACNAYHTAARISALAVAEGCEAAVGFQDEFDDGLAELFFATFYGKWNDLKHDAFKAFREAWRDLRGRPELRGTGVVLWTASPVLSAARPAPPAPALTSIAPPRRTKKAPAKAARQLLDVEIRPYANLNYSLLHNNRDLFQTFRIRKHEPEPVSGVDVEVVLHAGSEAFPYRASIDLEEPVTELRDRIRVPLTSALGRSLRESVHTVIYVHVSWNGQTVYRNTERVTLLPPDEWRDDENRHWLPSFVLPRDPAILKIVDSAGRYLRALRDDSAAGFDGYQSIQPGAEDPSEGVDLQVQALWAALSFEYGLGYINPPPTYSASSQRLRTPSEILRGHRGTCIDLALLLVACLEYVEIYPVIFLLEGHAFPGYWRSPDQQQDFAQAKGLTAAEELAVGPGNELVGQGVAWQVGKEAYREVIARVHQRQLVPLETVVLTSQSSFQDALRQGLENLRSRQDFHSLIDVLLARANQVTPLPLREPGE
jgi:hypothetical protein